MAKFHVHSVNAASHVAEHLVIEADHDLDAAQQVVQRGGIPVSVRPVRAGWLGLLLSPLGNTQRIGIDALSLFAEQLAELLGAGLTLEQALALLAAQDVGAQQSRLAERLLQRIRTGQSLSVALGQEENIPAAFSGIVAGAERSGSLASGFSTVANYLDRQRETARRVRSALAYPVVVLFVTLFALVFILTIVIPEFAPLFSGEEHRLPRITRAVLFLSDLIVNRLYLVLLVMFVIAVTVHLAFRLSRRVYSAGRAFQLWLPPVRYAMRLEFSRTIRVLGALLSSGIEASEAMELTAVSASSSVVRQQFADAARALREGRSINAVLSGITHLPQSVITLIAVGEQTGEIGKAATRAAHLLESDTNQRIDRFLAALNPAAVMVLGGLVAILIASVMLGIMSINQLALN